MKVDRIVVFHAVGHKPTKGIYTKETSPSVMCLFNILGYAGGYTFREDKTLRPGEIHIKLDCF